MERVFVTGLGLVTPLGNTVPANWRALRNGECGIDRVTIIETDDLAVTIGGEVRGLDPAVVEVNKQVSARRMDRSSLFAVAAAREAMEDAGLPAWRDSNRAAVVLGSGLCGLWTLTEQLAVLEERGPSRVSPFAIPMLMPNSAPANVGLAFGVNGPCYTVSTACASSGHAMIDAYEMIRGGRYDVVISGGTEASMTRLGFAAFIRMKAMATGFNDTPKQAVRPFEKNRRGLIMSEGAGVLVLESERHLRERGGRAYAEFRGYGSTSDAHHLVKPEETGEQMAEAIEGAISHAGWTPTDITDELYISAHGTGTYLNDVTETKALQHVFGEAASRLRISSTKSMTGHMIGATCGVEMAICALSLRDQVLPPTINYEIADEECPLDYIPNQAREAAIHKTLNNSFGFGGHNVCLAMQRSNEASVPLRAAESRRLA